MRKQGARTGSAGAAVGSASPRTAGLVGTVTGPSPTTGATSAVFVSPSVPSGESGVAPGVVCEGYNNRCYEQHERRQPDPQRSRQPDQELTGLKCDGIDGGPVEYLCDGP